MLRTLQRGLPVGGLVRGRAGSRHEITTQYANQTITRGLRSAKGKIRLRVPPGGDQGQMHPIHERGKPEPRPELMNGRGPRAAIASLFVTPCSRSRAAAWRATAEAQFM